MVKTGFFQFSPVFGEVSRNLDEVTDALRNVEADLIVLPELPFTGYSFRDRSELENYAEVPADSCAVKSLTEICREREIFIVTGFAERCPQTGKCYNSALLIGSEGLMHTYRKLHLFNTEKDYFNAGDLPLEVIEIEGMKIGLMVCFDWIFPEVVRTLAIKGVDLICHPANLVLTFCHQTMISRCIENSVFAVTANRCGKETRPHGELVFTGQSQIVAPKGRLIYRSGSENADLFVTEIDVSLSRDKKITEQNDVIMDRRPEFYEI